MCNDRPENANDARRVADYMAMHCKPAPRPDHVVLTEVSNELESLHFKIDALGRFLQADAELSEVHKELLKSQLIAMKEYAKVLCMRITSLAVAIKCRMEESSDSE